MSRVPQKNRLVRALQLDVETQTVFVAGSDHGVTAFGGKRIQQRVTRKLLAGEIGTGEQPVEKTAREDGDQDERGRIRLRRTGKHRGEAVAPFVVGAGAAPAGEGPAVAAKGTG
jgi:hypothetical protein